MGLVLHMDMSNGVITGEPLGLVPSEEILCTGEVTRRAACVVYLCEHVVKIALYSVEKVFVCVFVQSISARSFLSSPNKDTFTTQSSTLETFVLERRPFRHVVVM